MVDDMGLIRFCTTRLEALAVPTHRCPELRRHMRDLTFDLGCGKGYAANGPAGVGQAMDESGPRRAQCTRVAVVPSRGIGHRVLC